MGGGWDVVGAGVWVGCGLGVGRGLGVGCGLGVAGVRLGEDWSDRGGNGVRLGEDWSDRGGNGVRLGVGEMRQRCGWDVRRGQKARPLRTAMLIWRRILVVHVRRSSHK